jgi:hypothetical protein
MSGYYSIPHHVFNDENLNRRQKMLFSIIHGFLHKQEYVTYKNKKLSELNMCIVKQVKIDLNKLVDQNYIKIEGATVSRKIYKGINYYSYISNKNHSALGSVDNSQLGTSMVPNESSLGTSLVPSTRYLYGTKSTPPLLIYKITNKITNQPPTPTEEQSEQQPSLLVGFSLNERLKTHFEQAPPKAIDQNTISEFYEQAEWHIVKRMKEKDLSEQEAFNQFVKLVDKCTFKKPLGYVKSSSNFSQNKLESVASHSFVVASAPELTDDERSENRLRLSKLLSNAINRV